MAWDDTPPSPQELKGSAPSWDSAPPTPRELGHDVAAKEDHSLWGAVKSAGQGIGDAVNALGTRPITDIAYEHLVQPAVDAYETHRDARGQGTLMGVLAGAAQGTGDVARTGRNMLVPASIPADVGIDSYQRGNSLGDAAHDALNAGIIVGAPSAIGAVARSPLAPALASDAGAVVKNVASDVGHKLLPRTMRGLASGETAQLLKGKVADAFSGPEALAPSPMSPTSIGMRDIFSGGGKPLMSGSTLGAAVVSAAAKNGPEAMARAHYIACQRDPAYAAACQKKDDSNGQ